MLKELKLKQKFTIILILILIGGITLVGIALAEVLYQSAEEQITSEALILIETMESVRHYTNTQVKPKLFDRLGTEFLAQAVPTYSALQVFETFRKRQNDQNFFLKEATLNPINLSNKADSFETELIEQFLKQQDTTELRGFRSFPGQQSFYIARPITVSEQSCLECHGSPNTAPKSLVERYGSTNGYGWKLNEIVGAGIISVPASEVINGARHSFFLIMGIVSIVFIAVIFLVNVMLNRHVIRPLKRMARSAQEVSMGYMDAEFDPSCNDEVGEIAKAFTRMKLSLEVAMDRLNRFSSSKRKCKAD